MDEILGAPVKTQAQRFPFKLGHYLLHGPEI